MSNPARSPTLRLARLAFTDLGFAVHVTIALGLLALASTVELSGSANPLIASATMVAVSLALARTRLASPVSLGLAFVVFTMCAGRFLDSGVRAVPARGISEYRLLAPPARALEALPVPSPGEVDTLFREADAACLGVFANALDAARVRLDGDRLARVVRVTEGCRNVAGLRGRTVPQSLLDRGAGLTAAEIAAFEQFPPRRVVRELRRAGAHAARIEWVKVFLAANHPDLPRFASENASVSDLAADYEVLAR